MHGTRQKIISSLGVAIGRTVQDGVSGSDLPSQRKKVLMEVKKTLWDAMILLPMLLTMVVVMGMPMNRYVTANTVTHTHKTPRRAKEWKRKKNTASIRRWHLFFAGV